MSKESTPLTIYYYVVGPLCFALGLSGNIMGYVVLLNKKLVNIGTRNIYRYLFIADSIFIIQMIIDVSCYHYGYDVTVLSNLSCKIYYYLSYTLATISPMLLVYISMERFISIKYPAKRFILRTNKNQFLYLLLVILFNLIYYMPYTFSFEFRLVNQVHNSRNKTVYECDFVNAKREKILTLMDLINRVIVPCLLITLTTIMVIVSIFKSRNRVFKNYTSAENRNYKRDVRLAVTSICLNIFYIVLTLPLPILLIFAKDASDFAFHFTFSMFWLS